MQPAPHPVLCGCCQWLAREYHPGVQADPARGAHCRTLRELRRGTLLSSLPPDSVILQASTRFSVTLNRNLSLQRVKFASA